MIETVIPGKESPQEWIMYFDGVFSLQGAGAGVLLVTPSGEHLKYVVQMHFTRKEATNNATEYEGADHSRRFTVSGETSQQGLPKPIDGSIR